MSLLEAVSGLALRYVSRERFLAWRAAYHSARAKLHPLMRTVYGSFDAPALRTHLEGRVGGSFQILMVHSSVNHMKPMYTSTPLDLARRRSPRDSICGEHPPAWGWSPSCFAGPRASCRAAIRCTGSRRWGPSPRPSRRSTTRKTSWETNSRSRPDGERA